MRRQLGRFETAETISDEYSSFNVAGILFLANGPNREVLRESLDKLQQRHPLLRVKIFQKGKKYYYDSESVPKIPLKILERDNDNHWKTIVESTLNQRLDTKSGPLIQGTYLVNNSQGQRNELIITCHHSIVDTSSLLTIFHELLSFCAAIEESRPLDEYPALPLFPPEEAFYPAAFSGLSQKFRTAAYMTRQIVDEFSYRKGTRSKQQTPPHLSGLCRILFTKTPSETTEEIIQASRKKRITLNSLLTAAMLKAVAKTIYKGQDLPLRYFTFADLRPYLKPPISVENLGSFHSMVRFTIPVETDQDLWALADCINQQIYRAFRRGDKFISALLTPPMMRLIIRLKSMRMGTIALSYQGNVTLQSSYGKIQVLGIRGYISNFPLGPEYTAAVRMFNKELWWDILYLDSDMDHSLAQEIEREIQNNLAEALMED